ncbi:pyridoxamine 5'-phosphate oxidase family protein [Rhodococcus tibetensis]|uniref:Pyridoxamine 5'-phosphate oxidase family protein n=1 Tax=Rhodococcus tibetensis TaxID=2965064 RepID=A0ABT1Q7C7_9NOCA|nr:pyridoxamine 5'-phosphate oxidase family protein [Rhodococcus sp. FXJ9.536]MCQ4118158.1 pyridoxamine 5'-phosphate oxidase family protein [Rhodococcus sp. FXJ9.536]
MTHWTQFETEAPDLAEAVIARFEAHKHHVLATVRRDGSPRVSGTEVEFYEGTLLLGSMVGARKVLDLRRDPRFALHSNPGHHSMKGGDAKISGRALEIVGERKQLIVDHYPDEIGEADVFELTVDEVVLTTVDGEHLYVDLWKPGRAITRFTK